MSKALWGWIILFHDETTENKPWLQKFPEFIWEKLDGIGFDKYPESHGPEEKICQPYLEPYSVSTANNSF